MRGGISKEWLHAACKDRQSIFDNSRQVDFDGLRGRLLSSSYAPEAGQPRHDDMLRELQARFDAHQSAGVVTLEYGTRMYYGRLHASAPT